MDTDNIRPTNKHCIKCGVLLDETNWPDCRVNKHEYICTEDRHKRDRDNQRRLRIIRLGGVLKDELSTIDSEQLRLIDEDAVTVAEFNDRIERKQEGYVYVVTDNTDSTWVKVGTTRNIRRRMGQYNTSRVPHWTMHVNFLVNGRWELETALIAALEKEGYPKARREFFQCTVEDATRVLKSLLTS